MEAGDGDRTAVWAAAVRGHLRALTSSTTWRETAGGAGRKAGEEVSRASCVGTRSPAPALTGRAGVLEGQGLSGARGPTCRLADDRSGRPPARHQPLREQRTLWMRTRLATKSEGPRPHSGRGSASAPCPPGEWGGQGKGVETIPGVQGEGGAGDSLAPQPRSGGQAGRPGQAGLEDAASGPQVGKNRTGGLISLVP